MATDLDCTAWHVREDAEAFVYVFGVGQVDEVLQQIEADTRCDEHPLDPHTSALLRAQILGPECCVCKKPTGFFDVYCTPFCDCESGDDCTHPVCQKCFGLHPERTWSGIVECHLCGHQQLYEEILSDWADRPMHAVECEDCGSMSSWPVGT